MPGERGARPERSLSPNGRAAAETAIELALVVLEARTPSADQLSDLADAIDSLNEGAFAIAADLAAGALKRRTLPATRRPASLARTLPDLKAAFAATRRFRALRDRSN